LQLFVQRFVQQIAKESVNTPTALNPMNPATISDATGSM
jgi:hypothetical protein